MLKFLIVIPIFNEEMVVAKVATITKKFSKNWADILLVNDGSTDRTREALDEIQIVHPDIKVHHQKINYGYGASLIFGFDYAIQNNYDYLITMDCDEQHQPKDLLRFKDFHLKVDIVSGSRYAKESKSIGIRPPIDRVEINKRITKKINQKYSLSLTDSFCGFKRYSVSILKSKIFTELGYAFPMEFWAYAHSLNLKIEELAVDKIYITDDRSFGDDLDKKRKRYRYYLEAWKSAEKKFKK